MDFDKLIEEFELADCAAALRPHLRRCVGFSLQHVDKVADVGTSRVGGDPDLPPDLVLPTRNDRPLDFIMQVNLAEASAHDLDGLLPKSGLLSFLWDLDDQPGSYDPANLDGFKTLYFPVGTQLVRRPNLDPKFTLPEHLATFWPGWTAPHPFSRTADQIDEKLSEDDVELGDNYWDFAKAIYLQDAPTGQQFLHRLGGHAHNVQGDMQLQAELVTNGIYLGGTEGYDDPRREQLEAVCEEWQLLLQLDSDDEFFWGDSGMLYYWIKSQKLAVCDFSKTWMTEQSC